MIIGIITDPAVGGTFVDWTIHYLLGHSVTDNPIRASTAHGHTPMQVKNHLKFDKWLQEVDTTQISTIYMHNFSSFDITESDESYCHETAKCVQKVQELTSKLIVVSLHDDQRLYHCTTAPRVIGDRFASAEEQHNHYVNRFFSRNKHKFSNAIFDYREFLALNHQPLESYFSIMPNINTDKVFYQLDPWELYCNFDVNKLFSWLGYSIKTNRLDHWKTIYCQWQQLHTQRVNFATDFRLILENILHGHDQDLTVYNLDVMQEAAIQHELIYGYNLNVKTWQLNKFENTYQLHQILEPNIHPV
jgi:hypothetical protein